MDDLRSEMERLEKRTRRYWFDDGIVEISVGLTLLVVALFFLVENSVGGAPTAPRIVNVIFASLIVVLALSVKWAARRLKDRFVHPRTGFVAYPRRRNRRWTRGALGGLLGLLFAIVIMRTPVVANWIPAVMGGLFAVGFFSMGRRVDLLRLPIEGFLAALAGVAVSLLQVSEDMGLALLFGVLALVIGCGGSVALVGYLRRTRPPEEA